MDIGTPASDLARACAAGRIRLSALVEALVDRRRTEPDRHGWIVTVPDAELRARAEELQARWDARADLPLYGLTFAVKDNIDVAGMATTAGCPDFAYVPVRTAPVVQRLLDAGALLLGKTNLDQFATGLTGSRSPYGACESVFGGGLISGGSSSGSAVVVAAGSVAFSLGTDTAGSGRVPAALNGIVGFKPTRGLLSTTGVVPACRSLDCVSVFAPDTTLATRVFRVARASTADEPWARAAPARLEVIRPPGSLRLGVPADGELEFFGDAGQRDRFAAGRERVLTRVAAGVPVSVGPLFEAGDLLYGGPWVAERLADLGDFLAAHPQSVLPVTRSVLENGHRFTAVEAFRARHRLAELRTWVRQLFASVDVLVLPTVGTTYTLAEIAEDPVGRNAHLGRYTQFANLLDLAAVTIPNGFTADGRPASLTLIGPAFSDLTLAALAADLEEPASPVASGPAVAGPASRPAAVPPPTDTVPLAVVGLHLRGESRNAELTDRCATLIGPAVTAPCYRLYRLTTADGGELPGLVRTGGPGEAIEVEVWRVPISAVGALLAGVPAPLSLGHVRLSDGREVLGFLCEAYAAGPAAEDITGTGGWRAYRASIEAGHRAAPTTAPVTTAFITI